MKDRAGGSVSGPTTGTLGGTIFRDLEYCLIGCECNLFLAGEMES